jgi:hypothetical protein
LLCLPRGGSLSSHGRWKGQQAECWSKLLYKDLNRIHERGGLMASWPLNTMTLATTFQHLNLGGRHQTISESYLGLEIEGWESFWSHYLEPWGCMQS